MQPVVRCALRRRKTYKAARQRSSLPKIPHAKRHCICMHVWHEHHGVECYRAREILQHRLRRHAGQFTKVIAGITELQPELSITRVARHRFAQCAEQRRERWDVLHCFVRNWRAAHHRQSQRITAQQEAVARTATAPQANCMIERSLRFWCAFATGPDIDRGDAAPGEPEE